MKKKRFFVKVQTLCSIVVHLVLMFSSVSAWADDYAHTTVTLDNITYQLNYSETYNDAYADVTSGENASGSIVIRDTIISNGHKYDTRVIWGSAFEDNSDITSLVIPKTVHTMYQKAFRNCSKLKSVNLSGNKHLTTIAEAVFEDCSKLESVNFDGCTSIVTIEKRAFSDCDEMLTLDLSKCTSLKTIADEAFFDDNVLEVVKFPPSLEKVGEDAFDHYGAANSSIRSVYLYGDDSTFGKVITNVDNDNFKDAVNIYYDHEMVTSDGNTFRKAQAITVGEHVQLIQANVFDTNVEQITFIDREKELTIDPGALDYNEKLSSLQFTTRVYVRENAFTNCTGLTEITFLDTAKVYKSGFAGCSGIKNIYVHYAKSHVPALVNNEAFDSDRYSDVTVTQCGPYNANDEEPWCKFSSKKVLETKTMDIDLAHDATITEGNVSAAKISMANSCNAMLMTLPFPVSSFYFGADADIYELTNSFAAMRNLVGILAQKMNKKDYELPENKPLLIITPHKEKDIKGTIDLFKEDSIKVSPIDYSVDTKSISGSSFGQVTGNISAKITSSNPYDVDNTVYVVDGGYLKRINSSLYTVSPSTVTISFLPTYKDYSLTIRDADDGSTQLLTSHQTITPHEKLGGWVSFYSETSDFEICSYENAGNDYEVYTITGTKKDDIDESTSLTLHKVTDGVINKGQAVLIKGQAGKELTMRMVTNGSTDNDAYTYNILQGVATDTPVSELCNDGCTYVYVLSCNSDGQNTGFYHYSTGKTLGANKAYIPGSVAAQAKALLISLDTDDPTAIDEIVNDKSVNNVYYDISGRKVSTTHNRNIYIMDKKKVAK